MKARIVLWAIFLWAPRLRTITHQLLIAYTAGQVGGGGAVRGNLLIWLRFEATGLGVAIFGQEIASPSIGPRPPSARSVWGQAM